MSHGSIKRRIVTLRSVDEMASTAVMHEGGLGAVIDGVSERLLSVRHQRILDKLARETDRVGPQVMVTVSDREVSRMQSELARQARDVEELGSGELEAKFGTGVKGGDWFGWLKSVLDHVDREEAHAILRPSSAEPEPLPDVARIAMTADWGTGLYGAPEIGNQIRKLAPFQMVLHLGDVYYSGTPEEIQERLLDVWPAGAGEKSRTLNSNHEMYSGGFGYFDLALPAFKQESSYFALQNRHWLLVCLDTAYVDHDMDAAQVGWLHSVLNQAKDRKIILFSHQQLFSRLDRQGPMLAKALADVLEAKLIRAWYWGHEHQCVIYDQHPDYGLLARCLGNGGIPEPRKPEVRHAQTARSVAGVAWKRLTPTVDSPSCLALDGPNPHVKGEEDKFVPHGFMTLEFNGPTLTERVFLADGTELFVNTIS